MLKTMYDQFKESGNVKLDSATHIGDLYTLVYVSDTHKMLVTIKTLETLSTVSYLELLLETGFANIVEIRFTAIA